MLRRLALSLVLSLASFSAYAAPHGLTAAQQAKAMDFAMADALFTLYHESAHALVAQFDLPVLGKEEDAADAFATIRILETLGDSATRHATLADIADGWYFSAEDSTGTSLDDQSYFDEHSSDVERAFGIVCMLAGADRRLFADLSRDYGLDSDQQDDCADIYDEAGRSWDRVLESHRATTPGAEIPVVYDPPGRFERFAAELRRRHIFEDVAAYLRAHYQLPERLSIHAEVCDDADAYFDPDPHEIVYCYDLAKDIYDRAAAHLFGPDKDSGPPGQSSN